MQRRCEGIAESLYFPWSGRFREARIARLSRDTAKQATTPEVKILRSESASLNDNMAELTLENLLLNKSMITGGEDGEQKARSLRSRRSSARSKHHAI